MTDNRKEKSNPARAAQGSVPEGERPTDVTKGDRQEVQAVQATAGDKGSKNTNDYETSGRDRNAEQGEQGVVPGNQTKNHSQVAAVPAPGADPNKKLRKTSKREHGSRKPGTEQTKAERATQTG